MLNAIRTKVARKVVTLTLVSCMLILSAAPNLGCFTQSVRVGAGAQGNQRTEHRQWFALWGLIPITQVNPEQSIGDATNFTVTTQFTPIDIVIGIFTGIVTIQPKTVIVER